MKRDQGISFRTESGRILKTQLVLKLCVLPLAIIPLLAGDLACPAADALRDIDQRCFDGDGGQRLTHALPPCAPDGVPLSGTLTTLTRHALVSWVPAPGSTASIVMWFTLGPVDSPR